MCTIKLCYIQYCEKTKKKCEKYHGTNIVSQMLLWSSDYSCFAAQVVFFWTYGTETQLYLQLIWGFYIFDISNVLPFLLTFDVPSLV